MDTFKIGDRVRLATSVMEGLELPYLNATGTVVSLLADQFYGVQLDEEFWKLKYNSNDKDSAYLVIPAGELSFIP